MLACFPRRRSLLIYSLDEVEGCRGAKELCAAAAHRQLRSALAAAIAHQLATRHPPYGALRRTHPGTTQAHHAFDRCCYQWLQHAVAPRWWCPARRPRCAEQACQPAHGDHAGGVRRVRHDRLHHDLQGGAPEPELLTVSPTTPHAIAPVRPLALLQDGKTISPWHDIPLEAGDGLYNFVAEIPKMTLKKMEVRLRQS
jgi:hypothetical protein